MLDVLENLRPGDIDSAGDAASRMGGKFIDQMLAAAKLLDGKLATRVHDVIPDDSA